MSKVLLRTNSSVCYTALGDRIDSRVESLIVQTRTPVSYHYPHEIGVVAVAARQFKQRCTGADLDVVTMGPEARYADLAACRYSEIQPVIPLVLRSRSATLPTDDHPVRACG